MKLNSSEKQAWFRVIKRHFKSKGKGLKKGWKEAARRLEVETGTFRLDADLREWVITTFVNQERAEGRLRTEGEIEALLRKKEPRQERVRQKRPKTSEPNIHDKCLQFYKSYEWRRVRFVALTLFGPVCMCCKSTNKVIHVDHIKPIRRYWDLRLDLNNLQILCEECNHGKGSWNETDFRSDAHKMLVVNYEKPRIGRLGFAIAS